MWKGKTMNPYKPEQAFDPEHPHPIAASALLQAWEQGRNAAAQAAGEAAVTVLLRHHSDASPFQQHMRRQSVANPARRVQPPAHLLAKAQDGAA